MKQVPKVRNNWRFAAVTIIVTTSANAECRSPLLSDNLWAAISAGKKRWVRGFIINIRNIYSLGLSPMCGKYVLKIFFKKSIPKNHQSLKGYLCRYSAILRGSGSSVTSAPGAMLRLI